MAVQAGFAKIAALLADPVREAMLVALADGRALPAGELAALAGVTPQSASGHLRKLVDGGVVSVWAQGRFRYFRLADEQVAAALETLANLGRPWPERARAARRPAHLVAARYCYHHLAGRLGVALADALVRHGYVEIADDAVSVTEAGADWAAANGIAIKGPLSGQRHIRLCLDWTERRFHLAGRIPSAMLDHLMETGRLVRGTERALRVTPAGKPWFEALGVEAPLA